MARIGACVLISIDGTSLTCAGVADAASGRATVRVDPAAFERAEAAAALARKLAAQHPVYGRTTGVGANRSQAVPGTDAGTHGQRLLRSHAGGGGPLIEDTLGRAMLVVRANQIAAGGSGVDPGVLAALAECVNRGLWPPAPVYGAIGTGDLTALAVTALCLLGERDWLPDAAATPRFALDPQDALAFISSNGATLGEAAIACADLIRLLGASTVIAALSHVAVGGSAEPYARPVQRARPHPGQDEVAAGCGVAIRPAAGRCEDPGSVRIPGPPPGPRRGAGRGRARGSRGDHGDQRRGREPARGRRGAGDLAQRKLPHRLRRPRPGRRPRRVVPDRGAVRGPARDADGARVHRAEPVPGDRPAAQLRPDDPGVRVAFGRR